MLEWWDSGTYFCNILKEFGGTGLKISENIISEDGTVYILTAGTPIYVKTADICAVTGKSNQWIGQLTSQGVMNKERTPHGSLYNLSDALHGYCEMLEARAGDDNNPQDEKIDRKKREADAKYKQAKADIASFQAKELAGEMHRSEDVANFTEDLIYYLRSALMALPGRLSVQITNIPDTAQVSEIIRKEIYAVMQEMATYKYDAKKYEERVRQRANRDAPDGDDED